jgi:hypothetical protein
MQVAEDGRLQIYLAEEVGAGGVRLAYFMPYTAPSTMMMSNTIWS